MPSVDRTHHVRLALTAGALLAFLTLLLPGSLAVSAEATGLTSQSAADVARQLEFRADWGLSTDPTYVASISNDPANYANPFRVPLNQAELVDLFARPDSDSLRTLIDFASDHSDVLGGIYVDQSTGGTVVVNATPAAGSVAEEESALVPAGSKVLIRQVDRSESQLQDVVDRISTQLQWLNANGVDVAEVYPDVVSNRIVVRLKKVTESAIKLLTSQFGDDLDIQEGTAAEPTSCTKTSCPPPWRGGIRISVPSGACTSGFIARDVSGAGQKFMISAGHCGGMGGTVKQNGTTVGTIVANNFHGTTSEDALLVQIDPSKKSNWIWWSLDGTNIDTTHTITSFSSVAVGTMTCQSGGFQDLVTCGRVIAKGVTLPYEGVTVQDLVHAGYYSQQGNSGAPVVSANGHTGYGIEAAMSGPYDQYFSPIWNIVNHMHVWLCINSSCTG